MRRVRGPGRRLDGLDPKKTSIFGRKLEKVLPKRARNGCAEGRAALAARRRGAAKRRMLRAVRCCRTVGTRVWASMASKKPPFAQRGGALWVTLYIALIDLRQREQTISAHSSCSACMPNASEWSVIHAGTALGVVCALAQRLVAPLHHGRVAD